MATTHPVEDTTDRPVILQQDVDLDPTDGTMRVKTETQEGPGLPGKIRDDIGALKNPYGLYYFDPDTESWEALAQVVYKVDSTKIEIIQSAANTSKKKWAPVLHVTVGGIRVTETCDHATCEGAGMPAEMLGAIEGGVVFYELAQGGRFAGLYRIKLDYDPPTP